MDATNVPGARAERCLIFDSEGVVRRAWVFPAAWNELDDESVFALLDGELPAPRALPVSETRSLACGDHSAVVASTHTAACTRSFFASLRNIRESESPVLIEGPPMIEEIRRCRQEMWSAIKAYTITLKREGVTPERTIVQVKAAVREGLDQAAACPDHVSRELVDSAVTWCIDAYYTGISTGPSVSEHGPKDVSE